MAEVRRGGAEDFAEEGEDKKEWPLEAPLAALRKRGKQDGGGTKETAT